MTAEQSTEFYDLKNAVILCHGGEFKFLFDLIFKSPRKVSFWSEIFQITKKLLRMIVLKHVSFFAMISDFAVPPNICTSALLGRQRSHWGLRVTQDVYFLLLTHTKQLLLMTFCQTTAGTGASFRTHGMTE